jgi:hypothetical protein
MAQTRIDFQRAWESDLVTVIKYAFVILKQVMA